MASAAFPALAKKATLSDGTTYGYIHVPAVPSKPTLLLLHGAPSSSYIRHHQGELLPKAGFGVLCPDLLGYGDTDRPKEVEKYRLKHMCPQVAELVTKVMGEEKVIGVGHDCSLAFIAVGFVLIDQQWNSERMNAMSEAAVGYATSWYIELFTSPEGASLVEKNDKAFDSLMYAKDPEDWKEHLGARGGLRKFLDAGKELPIADWISAEELAMHNRILKDAYDGPFNWYKAMMLLGPEEEDMALTAEDKTVDVPTLLVATAKDYAIVEEHQIYGTKAAAKDCRVERLNTGHWAMLEDKEGVEAFLEKFAAEMAPRSKA